MCTYVVHELVNIGTENTESGTIKFILSTVNPLTFFTFFVMIKFAHEKFLWKFLFFRPPKYYGTWIGYITQRTTGLSGNEETYKPVQLKIVQDFSRMKILFWSKDVTDPTRSDPTESKVIGISGSEGGDSVLTYAWSGYSLLGRSQLNHSTEHGDEYLSGNYVSNYPRVGHVKVRKVKNLDDHFYGRAQVLSSRSGRSYLGVYVNRKYIEKFLTEMKTITKSDYSELVKIQSERDKSKYHVTLIHPEEYDEMSHKYLVGKSFWFDLIGLGTQKENAHSTYYLSLIHI